MKVTITFVDGANGVDISSEIEPGGENKPGATSGAVNLLRMVKAFVFAIHAAESGDITVRAMVDCVLAAGAQAATGGRGDKVN